MEAVKDTDKIKAFLDPGYGSGSGYGYGSGSGVEELDGKKIYQIDGLQTTLFSIKGNVAKGAVLQNDLTWKPCYIAKGGGKFAHGETLRDAMTALTDKLFDDMPEEERIAEFVKAHPEYRKPYPNRDLYDWHHRLTGSCEMGRNAFVEDKGLNLDDSSTIEEFVKVTGYSYGGTTIRKLPAAYGEE